MTPAFQRQANLLHARRIRLKQQPAPIPAVPRLPFRGACVSILVGIQAADEAGPVALDDRHDGRIRGAVACGRAAVHILGTPDKHS